MESPNISDTSLLAVSTAESNRAVKSIRARFAKDVLVFSWANFASLLLNGVLTFLLPRCLPVEDFGYYRLFVLYSSIAGILHLGLLDGVLVRWADRPDERIGSEIKSILAFVLVQHAVVLAPACVALVLWVHTPQYVWLAVGVAAFYVVFNTSMTGQIALQARKQFSELSFFTVFTTALLLAFVVVLKLLGRLNSSTAVASYVAANLLAGFGIWRVALMPGGAPIPPFHEVKKVGLENIRFGWKLLVANLLLVVTPNLDRFFVSGSFSIRDFAIYAFAGNALAIVYTLAMSVARVIYPYLTDGTTSEDRRRAYNLGQETVLSLWTLSLTLYFPTAFLVAWVVPKYAASLPIVRLLMINCGFVCMIHILHGNYFRVNLALNRFLAGSVVGVLASALLLGLARHTANLQWVAAAMTAATLIWWTVNEALLLPYLGGSWAERTRILALWFVSSIAFFGACALPSLWLGGIVYAIASALVLAFAFGKTIVPALVRSFGLVR